MTRRTPHRHGFTLIELLVVISIIALLISILLPSLAAARQTARNSQALSNVRQLNLAAVGLANESNGYLPHNVAATLGGYWRSGDYGYSNLAGRTDTRWFHFVARFMGKDPLSNPAWQNGDSAFKDPNRTLDRGIWGDVSHVDFEINSMMGGNWADQQWSKDWYNNKGPARLDDMESSTFYMGNAPLQKWGAADPYMTTFALHLDGGWPVGDHPWQWAYSADQNLFLTQWIFADGHGTQMRKAEWDSKTPGQKHNFIVRGNREGGPY